MLSFETGTGLQSNKTQTNLNEAPAINSTASILPITVKGLNPGESML